MGHRTWRACAWIVAVAGVCSLGTAQAADPKGRSAEDAEVADLVERGIELRRVGQDAQALLLFEAALERAPRSARVRVHVATTHQALGQWIEADRYLRQLLREADDPYVIRHRATLEKAAEFVDRQLGNLDVTGDPVGAEVRLSGQRVGTLPLHEPVRAPAGSYLLEVQSPGYYPISRPVVLTARAFLRESVSLTEREVPPLSLASTPISIEGEPSARSPRWLTWTLAGLGAGAALTSGLAVAVRESHADRWNGDSCLAPDMTRGQVCQDELDAGRTAESVALTSGIISAIFFGGALTSYLFEAPDEPSAEPTLGEARARRASALRCGVGWTGAGCRGEF